MSCLCGIPQKVQFLSIIIIIFVTLICFSWQQNIKWVVIMENKILWLCYFHNAKNKIEYWFMICDQYESSTFGKLKFVKKMNIFSDFRIQHIIFSFPSNSVKMYKCTYSCTWRITSGEVQYFVSFWTSSLQSCMIFDCSSLCMKLTAHVCLLLRFELCEATLPRPTCWWRGA